MKSEQINELAKALCAAQAVMTGAKKDTQNPYFKSNYADLASVWEACRKPLSDHGLSVSQTMSGTVQTGVVVNTVLMHSSGQFIESNIPLILGKNDMQQLGSAVTYARRYSLAAIVGVSQADDDANLAVSAASPIYPDQPTVGDGVAFQQSYRIPFGKYNKRSLEEVDVKDLANYVTYIEKKAEKDNKPISGAVLDFVNRASSYIATIENENLDHITKEIEMNGVR